MSIIHQTKYLATPQNSLKIFDFIYFTVLSLLAKKATVLPSTLFYVARTRVFAGKTPQLRQLKKKIKTILPHLSKIRFHRDSCCFVFNGCSVFMKAFGVK